VRRNPGSLAIRIPWSESPVAPPPTQVFTSFREANQALARIASEIAQRDGFLAKTGFQILVDGDAYEGRIDVVSAKRDPSGSRRNLLEHVILVAQNNLSDDPRMVELVRAGASHSGKSFLAYRQGWRDWLEVWEAIADQEGFRKATVHALPFTAPALPSRPSSRGLAPVVPIRPAATTQDPRAPRADRGTGYDPPRIGARYDKSLSTVEIARRIRVDIAEAIRRGILPAGTKVSVTTKSFSGGTSISVTLAAFPGRILTDEFVAWVEAGAHGSIPDGGRHTPAVNAALRVLKQIVKAYHYDRSDTATDYFHVNFYEHVGVDYDLEGRDLGRAPTPPRAPKPRGTKTPRTGRRGRR